MFEQVEAKCSAYLQAQMATDAAHDMQHIERVVLMARRLAEVEGADLAVVLPAAWLHDCVTLPKNAPNRHEASQLAAVEAIRFCAQLSIQKRI